MGQFVIKPQENKDFYVVWSTTSDGPILWGTKEELFEECPYWEEAWLTWADPKGPSFKWGRPTIYTNTRLDEEDELTLCNVNVERPDYFSSIKVKHLKKFCKSYNAETDEFSDKYVIYEPVED